MIKADNRIKISDFAKLTGSTLKTIIYYHKIGLLHEPERSPGGYRLYGPEKLTRMRFIQYLKSLGVDLKHIKEILGDIHNHRTLRQILQSLQAELLNGIKTLEERVTKIEMLLNEEKVQLDDKSCSSSSFQMITEILGPEQVEQYIVTCPELFCQQRKIFGILDNFRWGDYRETFQTLAEYFKTHPGQYKTALEYGKRLAKLADMSEDDPEIEILAWEAAEFIKNTPLLKDLLYNKTALPLEGLLNEMVGSVRSPAQMKHKQLIQRYLNYHS